MLCTASHCVRFENHADKHVKWSIQELILHKFKLGYNAAEATKKNVCHEKGEGTVDHITNG